MIIDPRRSRPDVELQTSHRQRAAPRHRLGEHQGPRGGPRSRENIAPISFFTVVGRFPPVLSITLQPRADGETLKDTFVKHPRHETNSW